MIDRMGSKFTREEFFGRLKEKNRTKIGEKAFLLANGMIDVHGFSKEKAFIEAVEIATAWYDNEKQYVPRKLK